MDKTNESSLNEAQEEHASELHDEVTAFSDHCAYIRSVYVLATRIWRDASEDDRKMMEQTSPSFFLDIGQVLAEYVVLAACRITDPAKTGKSENLTLETFVDSFQPDSQTGKKLDELRNRMHQHRKKIEPARNKLVAHADRDAIREGKPLGKAGWEEWDDFWVSLGEFVRTLNERTKGSSFDINVAGVPGDAEVLIKSMRQSRYFETLLKDGAPPVRDACLELALSKEK